jgi:hypothetical protein
MRKIIGAIIAYILLQLVLPSVWEKIMTTAPAWAMRLVLFGLTVLLLVFVAFSEPVYTRLSKPHQYPLSSTAIVFAALAVLCAAGWWFFIVRKPESSSAANKSPFSVAINSALVSDSGPLTMFMVSYNSMYGNTASPVFYLAYIQITNVQDAPCTLTDIAIAAAKDREGPWEELIQISPSTTTLYVLATTPSPMVLTGLDGTARFSSPKTKEDMKHAGVLTALPTLESEARKPIPPHTPIYGWVLLSSPLHAGLSPGAIFFRLTLTDSENHQDVYITELPRRVGRRSSMEINLGTLQVLGVVSDISTFDVRYYGDPYPSPDIKRQ